MTLHGSLHVDSAELIELWEHEGTDWVRVGPTSVFCDDASTAETLSQKFAELAAKMRERRGLPDPALRELVEFA